MAAETQHHTLLLGHMWSPDSPVCSVQLLYTGDFSRQEDRHLMAAEIPSVKPDILITVSVPAAPLTVCP